MSLKEVYVSSVTWGTWAKLATMILAAESPEFTSNEIWAYLQSKNVSPPDEPRAMGPILHWAVDVGLLAPTTEMKSAVRPATKNHRRPQRVYASQVWGQVPFAPDWPTIALPASIL